MQAKLSNTVKVYSLNREEVLTKLSKIARELISQDKNVLKIVLFGSLSNSNYSPHSDIDLLIILANDKRRRMDRIPQYLLYFLSVGLPVDVFPFTIEEVVKAGENSFFKRINENGIILAQKE
ncbi:MAG: nucleotidyltransferase domain-containing protein [Candidatus Edwardsbacteria bacterium]